MNVSDPKVQTACGVLLVTAIVYSGYYFFSRPSAKPVTSAKKKPSQRETVTKRSSSSTASATETPSAESTDCLKGYKVLADGRKTTYFNRELSSEEKSLLGDSTPKPITSSSPQPITPQTPLQSQSAWNAAGTWEERDHSAWAKDQLTSLLQASAVQASTGSAAVTQVKTITGDASITMSRGRKKYIYDYSSVIEWKMTVSGLPVTGELSIEDITGEKAYEMTARFHNLPQGTASKTTKAMVGDLQKAVRTQLDRFLIEFQNMSA